MRNAQRSADHRAPAVIIEIRLELRLAAQRELLGVGVGALPLERQIAMNSLAAAIRAIANEPAVASRPSTLTSRPTEPATTASSAESTTASTSTTETATAPGTTSAGTSWSARDTARLAFDSGSR
jgi:hypothetical protein